MSRNLVKSGKLVKSSTSTVTSHLDAVGRAREIYLSQIRRAEMEYFDRIKHVTEAFATPSEEPVASSVPPAAAAE